VLTEAAAQGLGITCQPDFIAGSFIAAGRVVEILVDYPGPELGIYAMLPSNRHMPHRVRVLMDFGRPAGALSHRRRNKSLPVTANPAGPAR
jgi:DNA-binding transcriptional LysR family regulator